MSLHKLAAGRGYDYLIRQVAALDATHRGRSDLASYYAERGESPGRWVGRGLTGLDGLAVGDEVTAGQMQRLFAEGRHPLHGPTRAPDGSELELGSRFQTAGAAQRPFPRELRARFAAYNTAAGRPAGAAIPAPVRHRIRTELARVWFRREHGRVPQDGLELSGAVIRWCRPGRVAVGGYDLTFSPVKSVSTLWAVADPVTAGRIESAHRAAVGDALRFIEDQALFTREGTHGVRQVNVTGLVATAFTHRDSRAGDPDLHTHVAVANKVQTRAGRWLSIDGRVLHAAGVSASEVYNTALEAHLSTDLGVRFADRPGRDASKRPVREIVGVDPRLIRHWSNRRQLIEVRQAELTATFAAEHCRVPTRVELLQLAQQATLETRPAKHEPRSLTEQRVTWRAQADQLLGPQAVKALVNRALSPAAGPRSVVNPDWMVQAAERMLLAVEERRATWQVWHLWAEAHRQLRGTGLHPKHVPAVARELVDEALARSVRLTTVEDPAGLPPELRRLDGASVFTVAGAAQYTSIRILAAEQRFLDAAERTDGRTLDPGTVDHSLTQAAKAGIVLDPGQASMVQTLATDPRRVQLVIAPAGTGKTTALRVLADTWALGGGHLLGLAPSATAAHQLAQTTGIRTDTLHRLSWALQQNRPLPDCAGQIGPRTLLLVDEAGMADTLTLDTTISHVLHQGGRVCLVGDDHQLGAVGAGGILTNLAAAHPPIRLTQLHRFADPAEAAATLQIRDGDPAGLDHYRHRNRIRVGDPIGLQDQILTAWQHDRDQGLDAIMLAPTRRQVADLNQHARTLRLANTIPAVEIGLADGNQASPGDPIITRRNNRHLTTGGHHWVRNGDRWTITDITEDGSIEASHQRTGRTIHLPADYVKDSVDLGYATTVHTAQGVTADTTHGLVDTLMTREQLYTMLSRGRHTNHLYVATPAGDLDHHGVVNGDSREPTVDETLHRILSRSGLPVSATTALARQASVQETPLTTTSRPEHQHCRAANLSPDRSVPDR